MILFMFDGNVLDGLKDEVGDVLSVGSGLNFLVGLILF